MPQALAYRQELQLIADIVRSNIALLGHTSIARACSTVRGQQSMPLATMQDHMFVSSLVLVAVLKHCLQPCPGVRTSVASVNIKHVCPTDG
jgi:hypothetical protein